MADPVLRIPVDDEAFKRYMAAFERYQAQLQEQPEMWDTTNESIRDGIAANLSLADAIGASVASAVRLGDVQDRNSARRRRDAQDADVEEQRAASWRRKSLDHVQELARGTATVVRGMSSFATGGGGGLFGGVSSVGKALGGTIGGIVNLAGHALNAHYEMNDNTSNRGLFAQGIGATLGQQEGFHNGLGRYTNTDQGLDAVMNARGTPSEWWQFNSLGVDRTRGSNADVYGNVLRQQANLARRYTDKNGVTNWAQVDPRGGSAFGTTHEDLNRLKGLSGDALDKAIREATDTKTSLGQKQIDAATKSVVATDKLTTKLQDDLLAVNANATGLDKVTTGLNRLAEVAEKLYNALPSWMGGPSKPAAPSKGWSWGIPGLFELHHAGTSGAAPAADDGTFGDRRGIHRTRGQDVATYRGIAAYLKRQGLSDASAMGAAAGVIAESHGDPNAYNKKSGAIGIEQLLGARKRNYLAMAKRDGVSANNLQEQLKFLNMELHGFGGEAGGKGVLGAKTWDEALHAYVYKFMRPQGAHNEHLADAVGDTNRGSAVVRAANVGVKVTVVAPPGHQTAVATNSAARG